MINKIKTSAKQLARSARFKITHANDPVTIFHSNHYLRHTARRLEHLASLQIPIAGASVLEVGAGIGDHSNFYIDRGCQLTITEAREDNLRYLKQRFPSHPVLFLDMDTPSTTQLPSFDIVHCYGLLYHLRNPKEALTFLSSHTKKMLFLETCVSYGNENAIHLTEELQFDPSQAYSGTGCRPTRTWIYNELSSLFQFVYIPTTQPWHEEFPLDWTTIPNANNTTLQRAVFIASREPLNNEQLNAHLLLQQKRHP